VNIVLKSQFVPASDKIGKLIAVSKEAIPEAEEAKRLAITLDANDRGLLPIDHLLVFAKGLLLYDITNRDAEIESMLQELYRILMLGQGKRLGDTQLLDDFINNNVFMLALPQAKAVDRDYYARQLKIRLLALVAA
jgi:hypothetical protein